MVDSGLSLLGGILCGGRSQRMGADKARLRDDEGTTLIERLAGEVSFVCNQLAISCSAEDDYSDLAIDGQRVVDTAAYRGPVIGLSQLLQLATARAADAVLIVPVDLPAINSSDLEDLANNFARFPSQIHTASFGSNRIEPLVAVYPVAFAEAISELATSEDRSISRWLKTQRHHKVPIRPEAGVGVNTPEQWQTFCDRNEHH